MSQESLKGQTVDRCDACGGTWFDESELGQVVTWTESSPLPHSNEPKSVTCLVCPKCDATMKLVNYAYDSGVFINKCQTCSGVWLAEGQLERIVSYRAGTPATKALANAMAAEICVANRWQRLRGIIRSRSLSSIVAVIYLLVALFATGDAEVVFRVFIFVLLPLACIWFPDAFGNLRGISLGLGRPAITQTTPGDFVAIGGWIVLLCPAIVILITRS